MYSIVYTQSRLKSGRNALVRPDSSYYVPIRIVQILHFKYMISGSVIFRMRLSDILVIMFLHCRRIRDYIRTRSPRPPSENTYTFYVSYVGPLSVNEVEGTFVTIKLFRPRTIDDNPEIEASLPSFESWKLRLRSGEGGADMLELNKSYAEVAFFGKSDGMPYLVFLENRLMWNVYSIEKITDKK